jgi:murein DD-endopeptidase MepM/ murein hydrolase activator NlpD
MHPLRELPQIISDPYKPPPPNKPEERHHGVDFGYWHYGERDSMLGEPVQAILPGVVAAVLNDKYPYGNMIIVETPRVIFPDSLRTSLPIPPGQSVYHLYAHMQNPPNFTIGQEISSCQPLGEVGESGNTDIPHLHLETRLGPAGKAFESMLFYSTRATQEEMENYVLWRTSGVFQHFDPLRLLAWK